MTKLILKKPLTHGQEQITELEFRTPVARDLKKYQLSDLGNFGKIQELSAQLCGLPVSVLDNLEMEDLVNCTKVISGFLPQSQEI